MPPAPRRDDAAGSARGGLTFKGPDRSEISPSSAAASQRMSRTRRRDTKPEVALRRLLHARGLRFRVDRPVLHDRRRRADIVFASARVVVFVDGCFWHGCPQHATWPTRNGAFWREKIETNRLRDRDTDARLASAGWDVVRVWEHEDPAAAADRVEKRVRARLGN
jgi:DNA mismatch endonuclease, patch repair protein